MVWYPEVEMASLVILIFLTHPRHSSSRVHSIFFSTGGGFTRATDCEKNMGVLHLRLATLEKGPSGGVEGVVGLFPAYKPEGGGGGGTFLPSDNVGLVRGLVRLVVRERSVG